MKFYRNLLYVLIIVMVIMAAWVIGSVDDPGMRAKVASEYILLEVVTIGIILGISRFSRK